MIAAGRTSQRRKSERRLRQPLGGGRQAEGNLPRGVISSRRKCTFSCSPVSCATKVPVKVYGPIATNPLQTIIGMLGPDEVKFPRLEEFNAGIIREEG